LIVTPLANINPLSVIVQLTEHPGGPGAEPPGMFHLEMQQVQIGILLEISLSEVS